MRRALKIVAVVVLAAAPSVGQKQLNVLVVYYSLTGHTKTMAEAVAEGARSVEGVEVSLRSVEHATPSDVLASDAIILGTPVYNANVVPEIQAFINSWPFEGGPLTDKVGAAFVTAGGISAGEELVQLSILHSMLIFGMIVVGGPEWSQPFGASAVTAESPFNTSDSADIGPAFLQKGYALGRRVARFTQRVHQ